MIEITGAKLRELSPTLTDTARADLYAKVLGDACAAAEIDSPKRLCNFFGQVGEETGGFRSLVESTKYSDKPGRAEFLVKTFSNVHGLAHAHRLIAQGAEAIGNTIYAGKNGNGDITSGDGFRFRGRGFLQITGRANYRVIGRLMKLDLEAQPELLGQPSFAADAAGQYWIANKINVPADADDVGTVTSLVNGGARLHLAERRRWHDQAKTIWQF